MQLLQIKLSGFKTFPDNTLININSNLVAIVGPNGCGKSNIIDAIRWVLGESSSKQLRADAMTDVVFNGSKYRKKASRASVSLTFSNHQHKLDGLWNTYDEIIIKRTISHDGDSEYFINNKLVRRRDITNLFLGTGLNASNKSYAIIEQGMVTKITSAKPEELKLYLEEVSGVSKYRDKRRDTIAQLSSVDLNLTRLMDLKQELELQINNLILDAQSAHQYNQLYQQKQQKELLRCMLFIYFYNNQIKQINLELITHKLTYNLTIENIQTLKSEQIVNENNLHQANLELENLNTEYIKLSTNLAVVNEKINNNNNNIKRAELELKELLNSKTQICNKITELEHLLQTNNDTQLHLLKNQLEEYLLAQDVDEELQYNLEIEYTTNTNNITNLKTTLDNLRHESKLLKHTLEYQQTKISDIQLKQKKFLSEIKHNEETKQQTQKQQDALNKDRIILHDELSQCNIDQTTLDLEYRELTAQQQLLNKELLDINNLIVELNAQLNAIKNSLPKNYKTLLNKHQNLVNSSNDNLAGNLVDEVELLSLKDFISNYLENRTVDPKNDFTKLSNLTLLDELFIVITNISNSTTTNNTNKLDLLLLNDKIKKILNNNKIILTDDGHLILDNFIILYANAGLGSNTLYIIDAAKQLIAIEEKLKELLLSQTNKKQQLLQLDNSITKNQSLTKNISNKILILTKKIQELELNLVRLDQSMLNYGSITQKLQLELDKTLPTKDTENDIIVDTELKLESIEHLLFESEQQYLHASNMQNEVLKKLNNIKSKITNNQQIIKQLNIKYELLLENTKNHNLLLQDKKLELTVILDKETIITNNIMNLKAEDLAFNITELTNNLSNLNTELTNKKTLINNLNTTIASTQTQLNNAIISHDKLLVLIEQANLNITTQQQDLSQYMHTLQTEYNYDPDLTPDSLSVPEELVENKLNLLDNTAIKKQLNLLNTQIDNILVDLKNMGAINQKSIAELELTNTRHAELEAQILDLNSSINLLKNIIQQIDQEIIIILNDTFVKVNEALCKYFKILFGDDGMASLKFLDTENILDSGISITARPSGKKNNNLNLLSGGEKALTAMSLIFAFFSLNPAPFCILDEVDAPLDDSNNARFCELIKQLSQDTQFIYISHNRNTMEIAKQLVGVTMEEAGVSSVVTTKLK